MHATTVHSSNQMSELFIESYRFHQSNLHDRQPEKADENSAQCSHVIHVTCMHGISDIYRLIMGCREWLFLLCACCVL